MRTRPEIWFAASHEQFPPSDLLTQAIAADKAGFDGIGCSDHFTPWWPQGESGQAWAWLGAAGQATRYQRLGSGVTALVHRYHPAVVAQAFMTLEDLFPGRVFLGAGSGEALNEIPCGADWPSPGAQIKRMDQALDVIGRLWDGETVTADHGWFRVMEARLHTRAKRRPDLYVSAFDPQAAAVAGKHGDGVWTLADPSSAEIVEAYRTAAREHGREPGKVILHTGFAWAQDEDELMQGVRPWRGKQPPQVFTDPIGTPEQIQDVARPKVDDALRKSFIVSTDPSEHIRRISEIDKLEPDVINLQLVGAADPLGTIALYEQEILPELRRQFDVSPSVT